MNTTFRQEKEMGICVGDIVKINMDWIGADISSGLNGCLGVVTTVRPMVDNDPDMYVVQVANTYGIFTREELVCVCESMHCIESPNKEDKVYVVSKIGSFICKNCICYTEKGCYCVRERYLMIDSDDILYACSAFIEKKENILNQLKSNIISPSKELMKGMKGHNKTNEELPPIDWKRNDS